MQPAQIEEVLNSVRSTHAQCDDHCALKRLWDEDITEIADRLEIAQRLWPQRNEKRQHQCVTVSRNGTFCWCGQEHESLPAAIIPDLTAEEIAEQKLERLEKQLEEIEEDATRRYDIANTTGVGWAQDTASAERRVAQELLRELRGL